LTPAAPLDRNPFEAAGPQNKAPGGFLLRPPGATIESWAAFTPFHPPSAARDNRTRSGDPRECSDVPAPATGRTGVTAVRHNSYR
ncbi:hypothetical protein, partial [Streptomyces anthocyanicus]|uniref:hypothetical protein n=1 Tax=Streptomyces anthocyanicus TaxID=68174 RepID=UPI003645AC6A